MTKLIVALRNFENAPKNQKATANPVSVYRTEGHKGNPKARWRKSIYLPTHGTNCNRHNLPFV